MEVESGMNSTTIQSAAPTLARYSHEIVLKRYTYEPPHRRWRRWDNTPLRGIYQRHIARRGQWHPVWFLGRFKGAVPAQDTAS